MSRLLGRTTQKVKEKTGQVFNRLRPSSQQDRATPPVPSDQRGYPVDLDPPSHSGISTGDDARIFQLPITLGQVDCPASGPSAAAPTAEVAVLVNTIALTALSSAESSSTRTFFTVAASAVDDLAGRRGSALILPLKAALIAIIQLTNTCNVSQSALIIFNSYRGVVAGYWRNYGRDRRAAEQAQSIRHYHQLTHDRRVRHNRRRPGPHKRYL